MKIRHEQPQDYREVETLTREAFLEKDTHAAYAYAGVGKRSLLT